MIDQRRFQIVCVFFWALSCCDLTTNNQAFDDSLEPACLSCGNTMWSDYNGPNGSCKLLSADNPGCAAERLKRK